MKKPNDHAEPTQKNIVINNLGTKDGQMACGVFISGNCHEVVMKTRVWLCLLNEHILWVDFSIIPV